jgi:demethylmenaquinone methyltransferase/2-methoxy-6-polyprenyl-1,4-benzoquinol methylase
VTQDSLNAHERPAASPQPGRTPGETTTPTDIPEPSNGSVGKDAATIRRMFAAIAPRYDLLNHLLSGGLDLYWRRAAVGALLHHLSPVAAASQVLASGAAASRLATGLPNGHSDWRNVRPAGRRGGQLVLDLCAGTLDLSCALADTRRFVGKCVALDFALPMLRRGRRKLGGRRARQILPLCGDALRLPFGDGSFDAVMVAFGVRNFEELDRGLLEARRVLAPGGRLLVLEFSQPPNPVFRALYELYSRRVLPTVGGAISGHASAYRYLPASVAEFPDARGLARRLEQAGYEGVRHRMLTGGIVALHEALKPPRCPSPAEGAPMGCGMA